MTNFSTLRTAHQQPTNYAQNQYSSVIPIDVQPILYGNNQGMRTEYVHQSGSNFHIARQSIYPAQSTMKPLPEKFFAPDIQNPRGWDTPLPIVPGVDNVAEDKESCRDMLLDIFNLIDERKDLQDIVCSVIDAQSELPPELNVPEYLGNTQQDISLEYQPDRLDMFQGSTSLDNLNSIVQQVETPVNELITPVPSPAANVENHPQTWTELQVAQPTFTEMFPGEEQPAATPVAELQSTTDINQPVKDVPVKRRRGRRLITSPPIATQHNTRKAYVPFLDLDDGSLTSCSSHSNDSDYKPISKKQRKSNAGRSPEDMREDNNKSSKISRQKKAQTERENEEQVKLLEAENNDLKQQRLISDQELDYLNKWHKDLLQRLACNLSNPHS